MKMLIIILVWGRPVKVTDRRHVTLLRELLNLDQQWTYMYCEVHISLKTIQRILTQDLGMWKIASWHHFFITCRCSKMVQISLWLRCF